MLLIQMKNCSIELLEIFVLAYLSYICTNLNGCTIMILVLTGYSMGAYLVSMQSCRSNWWLSGEIIAKFMLDLNESLT